MTHALTLVKAKLSQALELLAVNKISHNILPDCTSYTFSGTKKGKAQVEDQETRVKRVIFEDLLYNFVKSDNNRTYLRTTREFSFTLLSISNESYRVLRRFLPFPSTECLRSTFSGEVSLLEAELTDITKAKKALDTVGNSSGMQSSKFIRSTLAIDAFAITNMIKPAQQVDPTHIFLYLVIPLDTRLHPFPVF